MHPDQLIAPGQTQTKCQMQNELDWFWCLNSFVFHGKKNALKSGLLKEDASPCFQPNVVIFDGAFCAVLSPKIHQWSCLHWGYFLFPKCWQQLFLKTKMVIMMKKTLTKIWWTTILWAMTLHSPVWQCQTGKQLDAAKIRKKGILMNVNFEVIRCAAELIATCVIQKGNGDQGKFDMHWNQMDCHWNVSTQATVRRNLLHTSKNSEHPFALLGPFPDNCWHASANAGQSALRWFWTQEKFVFSLTQANTGWNWHKQRKNLFLVGHSHWPFGWLWEGFLLSSFI